MRSITALLTALILISTASSAQSPVKQTEAELSTVAPVIDGKLTDQVWSKTTEFGGFRILSEAGKSPEAQTFVRVLTDGKSLFVGFRCVERKMESIKAEKRERDKDTWADDSVEVIIDPTNDREKVYHLMVNAAGSIYDAECIVQSAEHTEDDAKWTGDWEAAVSRGKGEWYAEWRIPFETLGISLDKHPCIGANFARSRMGARTEFSSWSPGERIFANPAYLAELLLPSRDMPACTVMFPKQSRVARGQQTLDFTVTNHSAKPARVRYAYTLSGEVSESDPITVAAKESRTVKLPINLTELGYHKLALQVKDADTGRSIYNCVRHLQVVPELEIEESLYSLYQKKASASIAVNLPKSVIEGARLVVTLMKEGSEKPLRETRVSISSDPAAVVVSFDLSAQPAGTYYMKVSLVSSGKTLASAQSRPMPYNPKPKVGFNKDGFMTVDGKPFFPVGIYTIQGRGESHDEVLAEAKKAGFNTTVYYAYTMPTIGNLLDAAGRHGIKAFVYPTTPFQARKPGFAREDILRDMKERVNHPALLGWYLADEPEGIGKADSDMVRDLYQTMKQADTEHPCSLVIMSAKAAKDYATDADIIWTDPYPIPHRPANYVADTVQGCVEAMWDRKPVWTIPQAFDWAVWSNGKPNGEHRPTPTEERAMTYMALIRGAKGIIYWAHTASKYYIRDYPEHWAAVKKLAGELQTLNPVLLRPDSKRIMKITPSDAPIDTMVKELGGQTYVFAVNREPKACKAHFAVSGMKGRKSVEVMFTRTSLTITDGEWDDTFEPLEVRVYKLNAMW